MERQRERESGKGGRESVCKVERDRDSERDGQ